VFAADEPEDRDLVISVFDRLDPEQADAFLASVLEDLSAGVTYRDRQIA